MRWLADLARGFADIFIAFAPRPNHLVREAARHRRGDTLDAWRRNAEVLRGDAKRLDRDWRKVVRW